MRGAVPPFPNTSPWRDAKQRDSLYFTFTM